MTTPDRPRLTLVSTETATPPVEVNRSELVAQFNMVCELRDNLITYATPEHPELMQAAVGDLFQMLSLQDTPLLEALNSLMTSKVIGQDDRNYLFVLFGAGKLVGDIVLIELRNLIVEQTLPPNNPYETIIASTSLPPNLGNYLVQGLQRISQHPRSSSARI